VPRTNLLVDRLSGPEAELVAPSIALLLVLLPPDADRFGRHAARRSPLANVPADCPDVLMWHTPGAPEEKVSADVSVEGPPDRFWMV